LVTSPDKAVAGSSMGDAATNVAEGNRSVSMPTLRMRLSRRASSLLSWVSSAVKLVSEGR